MNKKLIFGLLSIALVAAVSIPAMMSTWNSCTITMHAGSGDTAGIGQFADCLCTCPVTCYSWGLLSQDQEYQMPLYVKNTGNQAVELYFYAYPKSANAWIPTIMGSVYPGDSTIYFNNMQVQFDLLVTVIQGPGMPCELGDINYYSNQIIPCKFLPYTQGSGLNTLETPFILNPGKVVKLDIQLFTNNLVNGATYDFTFTLDGKTVSGTHDGMHDDF